MKNYKFYFKNVNNGESFSEYIKANNYTEAVDIADSREDAEIDVDKTVMAFFRN